MKQLQIIEEGTVMDDAPKKASKVARHEPVVTPQGIDGMLQTAVANGWDVERLQKLIDMRNAEIERQAKEKFNECFATMQATFEPVARTKKTDKAAYAPLDALQKQYNPSIFKHGFSYRWSEESLDNGGLRVFMTISGFGHSETIHKDLPPFEPEKGSQSGKPIMNSLQAEGTRSSYGRRYTFISGFGLIIEDEDTDGSFDDGVKYGQYIQLLQDADSIDALRTQRDFVYSQIGNDAKGKAILGKVARKCAEALQKNA